MTDSGDAAVTDRVHDNSWSANLEGPEHENDLEFVERCGCGGYVLRAHVREV